MSDGLNRDEVTALLAQTHSLLVGHKSGEIDTERARDGLEQLIAGAAGQMSDNDRRAVAACCERVISAHWSDEITLDEACGIIEDVAAAGNNNDRDFRTFVRARVKGRSDL